MPLHLVGAADAPAQVLDVLRIDLDQLAPGDGAAVDGVASELQVHRVARQQRARAVDVTGLDAHVHLGHQGLLHAAVGQGHVLLDQPDDVADQLRQLYNSRADALPCRCGQTKTCNSHQRPLNLPSTHMATATTAEMPALYPMTRKNSPHANEKYSPPWTIQRSSGIARKTPKRNAKLTAKSAPTKSAPRIFS
ncbi:MAG: hypothetical protein JSS14_29030 [Proteobacteria bacterium]|nr:hypothetical protein [Pseudomonadota bacterium]